MSLLYLVRHGQASFFAENYDRLSALGKRQARRLGEYLAARNVKFDAVYSGPAERQQRTTQIVLETMAAAGCPSPEPTIIPGLNEHGGDKLLSKPHLQLVVEKYPELGGLEQAFRDAREPEDVQRSFQKLFEAAVLLWTKGELNAPGMELWDEFHERARARSSRSSRMPGVARRRSPCHRSDRSRWPCRWRWPRRFPSASIWAGGCGTPR